MDNNVLTVGFFITILGIGGMVYINNVYIPEQEEIILLPVQKRIRLSVSVGHFEPRIPEAKRSRSLDTRQSYNG